MTRFLVLLVSWTVDFLIIGILVYCIWAWGESVGYQDGYSTALKTAYKTNPPSDQLEMTCAGLWVGEQNKKYWNKENASNTK